MVVIFRFILKNKLAPWNLSNKSSIMRIRYLLLIVTLFNCMRSTHIVREPSSFFTNNTGTPNREILGLMTPLPRRTLNCSLYSLCSFGFLFYAYKVLKLIFQLSLMNHTCIIRSPSGYLMFLSKEAYEVSCLL